MARGRLQSPSATPSRAQHMILADDVAQGLRPIQLQVASKPLSGGGCAVGLSERLYAYSTIPIGVRSGRYPQGML